SDEDGDDAGLLDEVISDAEPAEEDAERLKDLGSEEPVTRLANQRSARGVQTPASEGHLEPFPDRLRVRYRYDGVLHEVEPPPARLQAAVISRIKIMSRLAIAERRLPADIRLGLERALDLPNSMVLVTGPTGSGKTTTLYTGLLKLNTVARN